MPNSNLSTMEQYKFSLRILAYSMAQQRETGVEVSLTEALALVLNEENSDTNSSVYSEGNALYQEALNLAEDFLGPSETQVIYDEHRTQPRLDISTPIQIKNITTGVKYEVNLADISWGGILVHTKELLIDKNDSIELFIPDINGTDINITGNIVRIWESDGVYNIAIRFSMMSYENEYRLNNVLRNLYGKQTGNTEVCFAYRIDVSFWDLGELKETLKEISKGTVLITTTEKLDLDKSIKIQINGTDDAFLMSLRARVVSQEPISTSGVEMYKTEFKLEHPTQELASMVNGIIKELN
jgi:hypothetical protein